MHIIYKLKQAFLMQNNTMNYCSRCMIILRLYGDLTILNTVIMRNWQMSFITNCELNLDINTALRL